MKKSIVLLSLIIFMLADSRNLSAATDNSAAAPFLGYYLCETEPVGEFGNPEVFSLQFNGEGQLQLYKGLYYGTTGTTSYYDYTSFSVDGNVLVGEYQNSYGYYGTNIETEPGSHQFILNGDGSISAEGHIWYRYEKNVDESVSSGVLPKVTDLDFPLGTYTSDTSFLGVKEISREEIEVVVFLDTFEDMPEQTWDVSAAKDGSVRMWMEDEEYRIVYIAAEGGVKANYWSNDLFRLCTNLKGIDFGCSFDTSGTSDFSYMFCDCKKLEEICGIDFLSTSTAYDMNSMFRGCETLRELDLRCFTTNTVSDMSQMFYGCKNLEELQIDNFVFNEECAVTDIFTGTKWEGSSPLLENADTQITVSSYDDEVQSDGEATEETKEVDLECMNPIINAYLSSGRRTGTYDTYGENIDVSYREADFWSMLVLYAIFTGHDTFSLDEISGIAYALFSDFDGTVPDIENGGMGVKLEGDQVKFFLATPEEQELVLIDYTVLEDGSIDAEYNHAYMRDDRVPDKVYVHFEVNDKADYASASPLYYRITSMCVSKSDG